MTDATKTPLYPAELDPTALGEPEPPSEVRAAGKRTIPLVYIAGKYTAPDALRMELNVRRAEEMAYAIARLGIMPVCPHTNLRYMAADLAKFLYPATLELMRVCDAVFLLPDWMESDGARGENADALRHGQPVFQSLQSLKLWAADWRRERGVA